MELGAIVELISTVGFPIVLVLVLGWFVYRIYQDTTKASQERENKLYQEIEKSQAVNAKAIETINLYADKLETIQEDIREIKTVLTLP